MTMNGKEALDFVLEQTDGSLKATVRVTEDPEDPDSARHTLELRYDDATGSVEFDLDGNGTNRIGKEGTLTLSLRPDGDKVSASLSFREDRRQNDADDLAMDVDLDLTVDRLQTPVEPLSENAKDLLAMSREELEALFRSLAGDPYYEN